MKTKRKSILAWHFLAEPVLPHGDGRAVVVGETLTVDPPIILCERGLHASRRAIDALHYAPGALVCRVRCSGEIVEEGDKLACSERTVLWMADAARVLRLFACDIAEEALLAERKRGREPHSDSWRAIEVARRWIDGRATDEERSAAWTAAESAARSVARSAAEIAALDAAGSAAWSAAWSAAESAANRMLERMLRRLERSAAKEGRDDDVARDLRADV
jgi:hypothetical protein